MTKYVNFLTLDRIHRSDKYIYIIEDRVKPGTRLVHTGPSNVR